MPKRPCSVPACDDKTSSRYSLPADARAREIWIKRIGNPKFVGIDDMTILHNYVVCRKHFADKCVNPNGSLIKLALPTLNLPAYNESVSTDESCFLSLKQSYYHTPKKIEDALEMLASTSTSLSPPKTKMSVQMPITVYKKQKIRLQQELATVDDVEPSSSGLQISKKIEDAREMLLSTSTSLSPPKTKDEQESSAADDVKPSSSRTSTLADLIRKHSVEVIQSDQEKQSLSKDCERAKFRGELRRVGVTRVRHLSRDAQIVYKRVCELKKIASRLKLKKVSAQQETRLLLKNLSQLEWLQDVNATTVQFMKSQIRTQKLKSRGRRFTIDDKVFALALSKQSGKAYRFLSQIFSLPSRRTLNKLLNKIPFNAGINEALFKHLKTKVANMLDINKNCVLMFDEMSLQSGLEYNNRNDCIDGFVDLGGCERRPSFADHALLFIVKGIKKKWKMPVCFTFCEGTTSTQDLVILIKQVVREVRKTGLHIMATISDQGSTNSAAINKLLEETNNHFKRKQEENKLQGYLVDEEEIVHLFDVPHLIKGIRNALLNKNLHFTKDGKEMVASWDHIVRLYDIDKNRGALSMMAKITDQHVIRDRIPKMKVKYCTQVFSDAVGRLMQYQAEISSDLPVESRFYLNPEAVGTAQALLFFDGLFDSVNGSSLHPLQYKELRSAVTPTSNHLTFWKSSITVLQSMYFTPLNSSSKTVTPSLKNWVFTLRSLIYLTSKLFKKGFQYIAPRNFNQDPIENYCP